MIFTRKLSIHGDQQGGIDLDDILFDEYDATCIVLQFTTFSCAAN